MEREENFISGECERENEFHIEIVCHCVECLDVVYFIYICAAYLYIPIQVYRYDSLYVLAVRCCCGCYCCWVFS